MVLACSAGEINSTLSGISSAPKLTVVSNDSWTVFMDGIIVNGQNFTGYSQYNVTNQGPTQTLALLDTGTNLARIPSLYANAIYSAVPGAQFDPSLGVYNLPCDTRIDLSFVFGGLAYPVHPIDTVQALPDSKGKVNCFSGFWVSSQGEYLSEDFVLGDSFLRNVYTLYDFGSFISGTTAPFIQLLSTTNVSTADSEFQTLSAQRNASITGKAHSNGGRTGARRSTMFWTVVLSAMGLGLVMVLN
ncbi:acid protease [Rickenella mellea]|uniref:Acid protease n=1 Tax=Rickenella mellea TaxID=50990 RepID=A0A4Y7PUU6_9AGAM|nr:acid protease [Rickenella mellea]